MCYILSGMSLLNWLGGCVHITYEERSDLIQVFLSNLCHMDNSPGLGERPYDSSLSSMSP